MDEGQQSTVTLCLRLFKGNMLISASETTRQFNRRRDLLNAESYDVGTPVK
jgi:hypothetical protein